MILILLDIIFWLVKSFIDSRVGK